MATGKVTWPEFVAIAAMLCILGAVIGAPALAVNGLSTRGTQCQNNLRQIGQALRMYAGESRGERWPSLSRIPGNWIFDVESVYPRYLSDPALLACPASPVHSLEDMRLRGSFEHPRFAPGDFHPNCVTHASYVYTGLVINSDEQAVAVYDASLQTPWDEFRAGDLRIMTPVWEGSPRERSDNFPVVWDRAPISARDIAHRPAGLNVLEMDGSVHFVRYHPDNATNNFPATRLSGLLFGASMPRLSADCPPPPLLE